MTFHRFTSVFVVGLAVLAVMIGGLFSWNETTDTGALTLEAPAFVQAAAAAEAAGRGRYGGLFQD
jgi:hypothetical protein